MFHCFRRRRRRPTFLVLNLAPTILAQIASNLVGRYPWVVSRRHSILVTLTPFSRSPGHICHFTKGNVVCDFPCKLPAQFASNLGGRLLWLTSEEREVTVTFQGHQLTFLSISCPQPSTYNSRSNCIKFGREVTLGCLSATFDFGDLDAIFKVTRSHLSFYHGQRCQRLTVQTTRTICFKFGWKVVVAHL